MERKLIKLSEDTMVKNDGTVRNGKNCIIQFVYGNSGADTIWQYKYELKLIKKSFKEIDDEHKFSSDEMKDHKSYDNNDFVDNLKAMKKLIFENVFKSLYGNAMDPDFNFYNSINQFMLPINLNIYIDMAKQFNNKKSDMNANDVLKILEELLSNKSTTLICMTKKDGTDKNSVKNIDEKICKLVLRACLFDAFSPKQVIQNYKLTKEQFVSIIVKISRNFLKSMVEQGEMVGVIAGTATGEPLTQMNLSSFHSSGVSRKNVGSVGVPRMREIFSATDTPKNPMMSIYLDKNIRNNLETAQRIQSNLKYTLFEEVIKSVECHYDSNPTFTTGFCKDDKIVPLTGQNSKNGCLTDISKLSYLIRIELDRKQMTDKKIKSEDILKKFCKKWENRFSDLKASKKDEKSVLNKISQVAIMRNENNEPKQIIHIRFNGKNYENDKFTLSTIDDFINLFINKTKIKGMDGINDVQNIFGDDTLVYNDETGEITKEKEYILYTAGTNIRDLCYLNGIDMTKTFSNNIIEMYNIYGIEVARSLLMSQVYNAYKLAGGEVNLQHIQLIIDQMTLGGFVNSVDRHGSNRSDTGPLGRASFEEAVKILYNASVFNEKDDMKGVSARIMSGLVIKGGTGYNDMILNTKMIEENETHYDNAFAPKHKNIVNDNIGNDILNQDVDDELFMPL